MFYYSVSIFESIGFSSVNAKWANLAAGCLNLSVSCFSPILMERVNRRPLMLTSCCGCAFFLMLLSVFYGFAVRLRHFSTVSLLTHALCFRKVQLSYRRCALSLSWVIFWCIKLVWVRFRSSVEVVSNLKTCIKID